MLLNGLTEYFTPWHAAEIGSSSKTTPLKIKILYWHLWFHEEPLTSMESFHCTKDYLYWKRFFKWLKCSSTKKKMVPQRTVHGKVYWGVLLWKPYFETFIFKSVSFRQALIHHFCGCQTHIASTCITKHLTKNWPANRIFFHIEMWNPNMKSVFHMHWGNSLANTCDRNVLGDMSVVFSPPSWGCHSASLLINSPQDWPLTLDFIGLSTGSWPLIGLLIECVTHRTPMMSTVPEIKHI